MCSLSSYVCLTGDMNARTSQLCDFITADKTIADIMQFDPETLEFFNKSEELCKLDINKFRVSSDRNTNNNGYKLIDICINNNIFILNGRFGKDKHVGKCTFREQSLIDYTICSINVIKQLKNFEVGDPDFLLSDGHSLLKWSFSTQLISENKDNLKQNKTYKKWDSRHVDTFLSNISSDSVDNLVLGLQPNKSCINAVVNEIACVFINAAETSFPVHVQKTNPQNNKPWFGPQCHKARKRYHMARNKYRRLRNEHSRTTLQDSSKSYRKTMNLHINKHKWKNANKLRQMHTAKPKEYWRYLNTVTNNKSKVKTPPMQYFFEYFKNVNASETHETFDFHESEYDAENSDQILNSKITESEISKAINGLKSGKSSGYDEILNEYIKTTKLTFMPLYSKLFNIIFDTGILPDAWLEGKIRPIYKNKGSQLDPENYRPITILSCLGKLFTAILNNRLTKYLELHESLHENQAGFRQGYSTTDHIFTLNSLIELFKSQKKKIFCTFIDFSKAFDTVWRIGLWEKLLNSSINGKMFRIIHNMYQGIKSSVSVKDENSPFFACDCGVRQGENLSPILFSLYLNDVEHFLLHKDLNGITIDIRNNEIMIYMRLFTLLYADDTVLMAESPEELQNCLNAFALYCRKWKLKINTEKTKIVIFGGRKTSNGRFKFTLDDMVIEIVDKYKYLGVIFSQSGSFLNARKHIVQQAKKAMILLFVRIRNLDLPFDLQLKLFDHTVLPILTYASEVWGYENIDMIEKIHNDFLRKITLARKSTPLYMLYGETGRFPLEIIVKSRMIGYWNRLIHSKGTKLSLLIYQCLFNSANAPSKWVSSIRNILNEIGRPDIWLNQENIQSKSLSTLIKRILIEQFIQDWCSKQSQSLKAFTYFSFKHNFGLEKYFLTVPRNVYLPLFKLRTSNHKLPVETGRWDGSARHERICQLCPLRDIGDEYHYICKCPYFAAERSIYVKPYYIKRPSMFKFCKLLGSNSEIEMRKLSQFAQILFRKFT